jgi:hypothetical protein
MSRKDQMRTLAPEPFYGRRMAIRDLFKTRGTCIAILHSVWYVHTWIEILQPDAAWRSSSVSSQRRKYARQ